MTRAEAEAVPSLGVPVPHSHPVSLGFARTMGTHLQESEHASRVCRTPDGVLSALRDRATPRYLPGLRTCHAWVHATPLHLPRLPTCHAPAPATPRSTPRYLPHPRTCHTPAPATPCTCHTPAPATPTHLSRLSTCHAPAPARLRTGAPAPRGTGEHCGTRGPHCPRPPYITCGAGPGAATVQRGAGPARQKCGSRGVIPVAVCTD